MNAENDTLDVADLPGTMNRKIRLIADTDTLKPLAAVEAEHILKVLDFTDGNKTRAASILGIDRKTLRGKLKRIDPTR